MSTELVSLCVALSTGYMHSKCLFSKREAPRGPGLGLGFTGFMPGFSISWYTPESRHSVSPGSLIASMPAHCLIFRKEELGGSSNSYPRLHMREGGAD